VNLLSYPGTARQWRLVRAAIIVLLAITGLAFESAYRGSVEYRSDLAAREVLE